MSEIKMKFRSVYLDGVTDVDIILPNPDIEVRNPAGFYETEHKFPVLWVLHGGYGTFADWITYGNIARLAIERGVMIVAPNAPNSDFINHPEVGEGYYYEDFFLKELIPFVHNWLPGMCDPAHNWLTGNSMGCAATWQYGIRHPDIFGAIGPLCNQPLDYTYLEPYRQMTSYEFRRFAADPKNKIPAAYGFVGAPMHHKEINNICKFDTVGGYLDSIENTLPRFLEAAERGALPKIFLPGGSAERDAKLDAFRRLCEDKGIDCITFQTFNEYTHTAAFWDKGVELFLDYLGVPKLDYTVLG